MSEHAYLSPSASSRWIACPPSVRLEQFYPDTESEAAREGTLAHELAELLLRRFLNRLEKYHGRVWERDIMKHELYTDAMRDYVEDYVQFVIEQYHTLLHLDPETEIVLESKIDLSTYVPDGHGRVDVQIRGARWLFVIDLKFGKGVPVSAVGNNQLRTYSTGALLKAGIGNVDYVRYFIHQPRLDSITSETLTAHALLSWANEILRPAAINAYHGIGDFKSGAHCKFCRAKSECRALATYNFEILKFVNMAPETLRPDEVAYVLSRSKEIIAYLNSVEEMALTKARGGTKYPGYKLVHGRSRRVITDEEKAATILLVDAMLPYDKVYKPRQLNTITALSSTLGAKQFDALLGPVVHKPEGSPTLVPEADTRPDISAERDAGTIFADFITKT